MHTQQTTCHKIQTFLSRSYVGFWPGGVTTQHSMWFIGDLIIPNDDKETRSMCARYWDQDECLYASVFMRVLPAAGLYTSVCTDVFPFCNCLLFLAERYLWEFQTNSSKTISQIECARSTIGGNTFFSAAAVSNVKLLTILHLLYIYIRAS